MMGERRVSCVAGRLWDGNPCLVPEAAVLAICPNVNTELMEDQLDVNSDRWPSFLLQHPICQSLHFNA